MIDKWDENYKRLIRCKDESNRLIFENDEEKLRFVLDCEKVYNRTTLEHVQWFKGNNFEGNVDERRWYRLGCYLIERSCI